MYLALHHVAWIMLIVFALTYWWHAAGIKQLALQATKQHCRTAGVQLLDQSIALAGISIRRDARGKPRLERHFRFEFASLGDERYPGLTIMRGKQCHHIELAAHRF